MRIRLLGTLDVSDDGLPVGLGGPRQKRVAACLVAAAPDSLTVDRLIDEVWGDRAPTTAAHVISTYVSNLRKVLGKRIISRDGRHGIDLSEDDVDAVRFAELLESSCRPDVDSSAWETGGWRLLPPSLAVHSCAGQV